MQPCLLMCSQHGIKHKSAINNCKQWLCTVVALCFIPFYGHINEYGRSILRTKVYAVLYKVSI